MASVTAPLSNSGDPRNFVGQRISEEPWWSAKRNQWAVTVVDGWHVKTNFYHNIDEAAEFIVMHPLHAKEEWS